MSVIHLTESSGDLLTDKQMIKILKEEVEELDMVIYSINDILNERTVIDPLLLNREGNQSIN